MASERASQQAFFWCVSALLFAASAAVTIVWCASMSAMGEMPMPGGWTMSMAWMRMPGQTWPGAAASFLCMWVVMMVAMMLPCLVPMLWRYRQAVGRTGETRLGRLTALVGVGYFFVWTVLGMAAFALGVALAAIAMQQPSLARGVPIAAGVVVLIAGCLQFTAWKARHLACCREARGRGRTLPADAGMAWRHGLRLGLHFYPNQLSEGTLRFLWLATVLLSPVLPPITLIDEPEVSLHPELLKILAGLIREASLRTQLIVATHADRLIRWLESSEVVVVERSSVPNCPGELVVVDVDQGPIAPRRSRSAGRRPAVSTDRP